MMYGADHSLCIFCPRKSSGVRATEGAKFLDSLGTRRIRYGRGFGLDLDLCVCLHVHPRALELIGFGMLISAQDMITSI